MTTEGVPQCPGPASCVPAAAPSASQAATAAVHPVRPRADFASQAGRPESEPAREPVPQFALGLVSSGTAVASLTITVGGV
jgi:hypothetical protein